MDRGNESDRERLSGVHRTEQTESKLNEDFVEWLKTKGPTWLLLGLIAMILYLGLVQWRDRQAAYERQAWAAFNESQFTGLPASFEDVADRYGDVGKLGVIARLEAGRLYLNAVRTNQPFDAGFELDEEDLFDPDRESLSSEDRDHYLNQAERAFRAVLDRDDGTDAMVIHAVTARNGLASVAEARGDVDEARRHYEQAAQRAEGRFPALARQARNRAETVAEAEAPIEFLSTDEIDARLRDRDLDEIDQPRRLSIENSLREFLLD